MQMRKLVAQTFTTLDGVMEAPDKWQFPNELFGDDAAAYCLDAYKSAGGLLLGRVTYEEFAEFWPTQSDEDPFAKRINELPKYVVTRTLKTLAWVPAEAINEIPAGVAKLKEGAGGDILIVGSAQVVNGLAKAGLIDEYQLFVHPIIVGRGKRLFDEGLDPTLFTLAETRTFGTGVIALTYQNKGKAALG